MTDTGNYRVRKISLPEWDHDRAREVATSYPGDGGSSDQCATGIPVRPGHRHQGQPRYITDVNRVRKISPDGNISTVAGDGSFGVPQEGEHSVGEALSTGPAGTAADRAAAALYIADVWNHRIRKVGSLSTGIISTVAGNGIAGDSGDGGPALSALINVPVALVKST